MTNPNSPATPSSSAARLAATVNTTEPTMDRRLTYASPAQLREQEITAALRAAGLQPEVDSSVVQRVARGCPAGADVAAWLVRADAEGIGHALGRPAGEDVQLGQRGAAERPPLSCWLLIGSARKTQQPPAPPGAVAFGRRAASGRPS